MKRVCLIALGLAIASPAFAFDGWHQESATPIPSKNAGYDYVAFDAKNNRVFLGHRKEGLQIFDFANKKLVKTLEGTPEHSSNGALLLPEHDLGISNNEDGTITPFKLSTLEPKEAVKLAEGIDTSHYDAGSKRIVVNTAAGKDGTELIVLEVPSLNKVGTIKVNTVKAEHAEGDGKGNFYLASRDPAKLYRIDVKNLKVTAEWATPGCDQTNSLAYDAANNRIFLGCRGSNTVKPSLAVVNADTGKVITTLPIGGGVDANGFDPDAGFAFASCGQDAVLTVAKQDSPDKFSVVQNVPTERGARTMTLDPKTHEIFLVTAKFGPAPAPTADQPHPRPAILPDSFEVLVVGK